MDVWDIIQHSQISEQRRKTGSLDKRIQRLEDELGDTRRLVYVLLQELKSHLPPVRQGPPLRSFICKVIGVTEGNADESERQTAIKRCQVGEQLVLVRQADGSRASNSVAVTRQSGEHLGFLPPDVADEVAPRLDLGLRVDGEVAKITGGGWLFRKPYGVDIKVTKYSMWPREAMA